MKTHSFNVKNLKCNGCANTIRKEVSKFSSVQSVTVNPELSLVTLELNDTMDEIVQIKQKLSRIGYPEAGTENNLITAAKSYVSCAVGRMTD